MWVQVHWAIITIRLMCALKEIGAWMKVNGDAIYSTRPVAPYKEGNICFTQNKDGRVNAIYLAAKKEITLPANYFFERYKA